MKPIVL